MYVYICFYTASVMISHISFQSFALHAMNISDKFFVYFLYWTLQFLFIKSLIAVGNEYSAVLKISLESFINEIR